MSCNFMLENKKTNSNVISTLNEEIININKNEAKILVKASQNNLDIIKLCQFIEDTKAKKDIKNLAKDIESTHVKIFKSYKKVAYENLISIPKYSNIETEILKADFVKDSIIVNKLDLISNKINNQIKLLNTLSKTTDNDELIKFSEKTNTILKLKLDETENTISKL